MTGGGCPPPSPVFDKNMIRWGLSGGLCKEYDSKGIVAFRLPFARTRGRCRARWKERREQREVEEALEPL
jgi:hypothetical protein